MSVPPYIAHPPRRVPLSLQVAMILGPATQLGWAIFAFGMLFFLVFAGQADISFVTMRGDLAIVEGRITEVQSTAASENKTRVMANHYEYSIAGRRLTGISYTTGESVEAGQKVAVEYKPDDPLRSRIEGMRTDVFSSWALVVTLFPLAGLIVVYFAMRNGFRRVHLLGEGVFATGKLLAKTPTNTRVNKQRVYELTFEFQARDGRRCQTKVRTHQTARLEDQTAEPLFYDPDRPAKAYLFDELPQRPVFGAGGELEGRPIAALLGLVLPVLIVAALWYVSRAGD